ncbi:glycosyltransferase family 2 protein [Azospirillum sp. SYSU D00513]|uniref:glycosyltransferase family 2 protein n=1 Tax=Azospirillum sp. SYSU D00513 TaxID=2812561 RepID=UPI001A9663D5|nr:glycosyltransferase family 2 protein [Azospirillum sp. SYSU D00513]
MPSERPSADPSAPNLCAVVPSRNHHKALPKVVEGLRAHGLAVILVDDGSDDPARTAIAALHAPEDGVEVIRLDPNQGKGAAVAAGLRRALARGFTHALQMDADGQHDAGALPALIAAHRANPGALVSGRPIYDGSVPRSRQIARWLTHVWVWVETLSLRIADSMCGFRVYPVAPTLAVMDSETVGRRMDFDTEIMVRLFWRGVPTVHVPVPVVYPPDNTSNFRLLQDNWLITRMHTRLVCTMLLRLPSVLRNRPPRTAAKEGAAPDGAALHWAAVGERGAWLGMRILSAIHRLIGRRGCIAALWPIVAYFHLTDRAGRRHSMDYLRRVHAAKGLPPPGRLDSLRHYMTFATKALDSFAAWDDPSRTGPLEVAGSEEIERLAAGGRGGLLIVSHLGNAELCRARLTERFNRPMNVLLHTRHARLYNRLLKSVNPDVEDHTIQVTEVGPDTAIDLTNRVQRGEWIAIAGDRTPVMGQARTSLVPFLGQDAPFSQGPYVLAALMGCPVFLMFCLREGDRHVVRFEHFSDRIELPRRNKDAALTELAARYARRLEEHCLSAPLQWYNFYDFWALPPGAGTKGTPAATDAPGADGTVPAAAPDRVRPLTSA